MHDRLLHVHPLAFPAWTCSRTQEAWVKDPEKWRTGLIPRTSVWGPNPEEPKNTSQSEDMVTDIYRYWSMSAMCVLHMSLHITRKRLYQMILQQYIYFAFILGNSRLHFQTIFILFYLNNPMIVCMWMVALLIFTLGAKSIYHYLYSV